MKAVKKSKVDYTKYFANQNTPIPNMHMSLNQCFDIIAYRNEQFDLIQKSMPEIANDVEKFFTELERRVEIKKLEMGV